MTPPRRLAVAPVVAFAGGAALTILVAGELGAAEREAEAARFQWRARAHAAALQRAVDAATVLVDSVAGLFRASVSVEREEFTAFLESTRRGHPGIRAMEWAPVIRADRAAQLEGEARRTGIADYHVHGGDPGGGAGLGGEALRVPVLYVEPPAGNLTVLGYDLASDPERRAALEVARDEGRAASTAPIQLVQAASGREGLLLVEPVYRSGAATAEVADRRAALAGYVVGVVDLPMLAEDALDDVSGGDVTVWLVDGASGTDEAVWGARTSHGRVERVDAAAFVPDREGAVRLSLELPGRTLGLVCAPVQLGTSPAASLTLVLFTAVGLAGSGALAAWLYAQGRREDEVRGMNAELEERVAARTAELESAAEDLRRETDVRRRAEIAERVGRVRLEALLHHLPGALWMVDAQLRLTSRAGARLGVFGLDRLDRSALSDAWPPDSPCASLLEAHREALAGGVALRELELDGAQYEVRVGPVTDPAIGGTIAVALDVTDRRRAEGERMEAHLLRAQKLESLGLLAGGIAHDFNNLLVGVLGNASLLTMRLPPEGREHAAAVRIEAAAQQAARLTRQMLAYSGRGQFVVEPTDVGVVARELGDLVGASISKKISLTWELAEGLPLVRADAAQLRQLFMNLLTNAADAIGDQTGWITVRTTVANLDEQRLSGTLLGGGLAPGRYVGLEVADTGCGMDAETVRMMWDPFFTTKPRGHGLGLSASFGILRGHQATVEVTSRVGEGSRVVVWFPAVAPNVVTPLPPAPSAPPEADHRPLRVLVIDDEEGVRSLVSEALGMRGDHVETAPDGMAGLESFGVDPAGWDVVVLDLTLPGLDGHEVLEALCRHETNVPVLLSSGYSERDAMERTSVRCPTAFLQKPYTLDALRAAVDALVRSARE